MTPKRQLELQKNKLNPNQALTNELGNFIDRADLILEELKKIPKTPPEEKEIDFSPVVRAIETLKEKPTQEPNKVISVTIIPGEKGEPGKDGTPGIPGEKGINGKDGEFIIGPQGLPGKDGENGKDGKDADPAPIFARIEDLQRQIKEGATLKDLGSKTKELTDLIQKAAGGWGGGSMLGTFYEEEFTVTAGMTSVTVAHNIAQAGKFVTGVFYQGQHLSKIRHYMNGPRTLAFDAATAAQFIEGDKITVDYMSGI